MPKQSLSTRMYTGAVNKAGDTPLSLAFSAAFWEVAKYLAITHHCDTKSIFQFGWLLHCI